MATNGSELEKLKSLLDYGIDHNEEHQDEVEEWANTARDLGYDQTGEILADASDKLGEVTNLLVDAMKKLNKGGR